jgi:hypothetical protein
VSGRAAAVAAAIACAAFVSGCASRGPAPPTGPRIAREDLPFLLPPSNGFPASADPQLLGRIDAAFRDKLLAGNGPGAVAVAQAALAVDTGFTPAEVLRAQERLVARDFGGARAILDPVVAQAPDYAAAALALARAAELSGDPVTAYTHYRRLSATYPAALDRAGELHSSAVSALAAQVEDALARSRVDDARERLALLTDWAPSDQATLEAGVAVARATNDSRAELQAVRGLLASARSGDEALLARRGELELDVGSASAAIEIFESLARKHPDQPGRADDVDRAKFAWRVQNLPSEVRSLVDTPELTRAEFAVLVYWLVPGVRAAVVSEPHIASDILDHPRRQEIMRIVNLQLMDVDETLRLFSPGARVHRVQALKALERVLQRATPEPSCVGSIGSNPSPSREAVCNVASACGLIAEPAECLPEGPVSGKDAAAWIRRTASLLD